MNAINDTETTFRTQWSAGGPIDLNSQSFGTDDAGPIRAEFLKTHLIADGAETRGKVSIKGAVFNGLISLDGQTLEFDIHFENCQFSHPISLHNTRLRDLSFSGCKLAGIDAENAIFLGSFKMANDTSCSREITLTGAEIEGDLNLCGVTLSSQGQDAIFAPGLTIGGSAYLGNNPYNDTQSHLAVTGALFFSSLTVADDVFVSHCSISLADQIGLESPVFNATEEHGSQIALSFARAKIGGLLYFQKNQINRGIVNLAGAKTTRFTDEPFGPGAAYALRLDGFTYQDFSRHSDISIDTRLKWLERRPKGMPFSAQPYQQLATVLSAIGHHADVTTVRMRKEKLLRQENRQSLKPGFRRIMLTLWDVVFGTVVGHGYRPSRALFIAIFLIIGLGVFFQKAWDAGDMTPNAATILVSADWQAVVKSHPENPARFWAQPGQAGQDWETFNAFAYAADLVIPILDLGQESAWAPSTSRSPLGQTGWWLRWFAKIIGWIITALGAGAVTGLIRRD